MVENLLLDFIYMVVHLFLGCIKQKFMILLRNEKNTDVVLAFIICIYVSALELHDSGRVSI